MIHRRTSTKDSSHVNSTQEEHGTNARLNQNTYSSVIHDACRANTIKNSCSPARRTSLKRDFSKPNVISNTTDNDESANATTVINRSNASYDVKSFNNKHKENNNSKDKKIDDTTMKISKSSSVGNSFSDVDAKRHETIMEKIGAIRIAERYALEERIGGGAFGMVFSGRDIITHEPVAIKLELLTGDNRSHLFLENRIYNLLNKHSYKNGNANIGVSSEGSHSTNCSPFCITTTNNNSNIDNSNNMKNIEESDDNGNKSNNDYIATSEFLRIIGIPHSYFCGRVGDYTVLVMDYLGPSLEELRLHCRRSFNLHTACMIGIQMIQRMEYVHAHGYLHRDIKPENFVMGRGANSHTVYVIDFGLAKNWRDAHGVHVPYEEGRSLTGTARYMSINTHRGIQQSRRDDLEAITYVIMFLLRGSLPWQGLKPTQTASRNKRDGKVTFNRRSSTLNYDYIREVKVKTTPEMLAEGYPHELAELIAYARGLSYEEKPDYTYCVQLLKKALQSENLECDCQYEWVPSSSAIHLTDSNVTSSRSETKLSGMRTTCSVYGMSDFLNNSLFLSNHSYNNASETHKNNGNNHTVTINKQMNCINSSKTNSENNNYNNHNNSFYSGGYMTNCVFPMHSVVGHSERHAHINNDNKNNLHTNINSANSNYDCYYNSNLSYKNEDNGAHASPSTIYSVINKYITRTTAINNNDENDVDNNINNSCDSSHSINDTFYNHAKDAISEDLYKQGNKQNTVFDDNSQIINIDNNNNNVAIESGPSFIGRMNNSIIDANRKMDNEIDMRKETSEENIDYAKCIDSAESSVHNLYFSPLHEPLLQSTERLMHKEKQSSPPPSPFAQLEEYEEEQEKQVQIKERQKQNYLCNLECLEYLQSKQNQYCAVPATSNVLNDETMTNQVNVIVDNYNLDCLSVYPDQM